MPPRILLLFLFVPLLLHGAEWRPLRVESLPAWEKHRRAILAAAQEIMGPLPGPEKRCALAPQVERELDAGSYVRRYITYASEPGDRTPAWLLIPKTALAGTPAPAVLCLHPTNAVIGHDGVVGLGGLPNRAYAKELAERGFVTIAPSYPLLAKYHPDLKQLGWVSGTMKGIWNHLRALDLLDSMPEVKPGRYGAIGHSLGGHNAIFAAAFDTRIQVVVTSCGFDSFQEYYGGDSSRWKLGAGWCQERYMPQLVSYAGRLSEIPFDYHELLASLAPRTVLISAPLHDSNFQAQSTRRCVEAALPVYALVNATDRLILTHPDCGHDFPEKVREQAYELFAAELGK